MDTAMVPEFHQTLSGKGPQQGFLQRRHTGGQLVCGRCWTPLIVRKTQITTTMRSRQAREPVCPPSQLLARPLISFYWLRRPRALVWYTLWRSVCPLLGRVSGHPWDHWTRHPQEAKRPPEPLILASLRLVNLPSWGLRTLIQAMLPTPELSLLLSLSSPPERAGPASPLSVCETGPLWPAVAGEALLTPCRPCPVGSPWPEIYDRRSDLILCSRGKFSPSNILTKKNPAGNRLEWQISIHGCMHG